MTLHELLLEYARLKNLPVTERTFSVSCTTEDGILVTIYREPAIHNHGVKMERYFGEIRNPMLRHGQMKYIDEQAAEHIVKRLTYVIGELRKNEI